MANHPQKFKFQKFAGSPDIFDIGTGKRVTEQEAQTAGLFTPQGLSPSIQQVTTPRPDIQTEADFARLAGRDIGFTPQTPAPPDPTKFDFDPATNITTVKPPVPPPEVDDTADQPDKTVGGTDEISGEITDTKVKIDKDLIDLSQEEPDTTSPEVDKLLADLQVQQDRIEKRLEEDLAKIEKEFEGAEGEVKLKQEEARSKAEGRTRIGGFITKMEIQDLQRLERGFRLESIALQGQKQTALTAARRAAENQDFELSKLEFDVARQADIDLTKKKQDHFNNLLKIQDRFRELNKPLRELEQDDVEYLIGLMEFAKSEFGDTDIVAAAFGDLKRGDIIARYLSSDEYKKSIKGDTKFETRVVDGRVVRFGFEGTEQVSRQDLGKSTTPGGGNIIPGGPEDTVAERLLEVGLDASVITTNNELTKGNRDRIVSEGVPPSIVDQITQAITSGLTLDEIRQSLKNDFGQDVGFGYLDSYMQTLQRGGGLDFDDF